MPTVADNIVATLKASGVRRIYGIPGDSLNGFTDAHPPWWRHRLGARSSRGVGGVRGRSRSGDHR